MQLRPVQKLLWTIIDMRLRMSDFASALHAPSTKRSRTQDFRFCSEPGPSNDTWSLAIQTFLGCGRPKRHFLR